MSKFGLREFGMVVVLFLAAYFMTAMAHAAEVQWRYAERTYLKWQSLVLVGFSKPEAVAQAKRDNMTYTAKTLQVSVDGGVTWFTPPPGKDIKVVDETFAVTGKMYGGD